MSQSKNQTLQNIINELNKTYLTKDALKEYKEEIARKAPLVVVFGGTGLIGKAVVKKLCSLGYRVRSVSRNPEQSYSMKQFGNVGQVQLVKGDVKNSEDLQIYMSDASSVIYAACGDSSKGVNSYNKVNYLAALKAAEIADAHKIPFIYFSSLQAHPKSASALATANFSGEDLLIYHHKTPIIIRPSLVFGAEDKLFNKIANASRFLCKIPVISNSSIFEPVYIGDIADFVGWLYESRYIEKVRIPSCFELGGPQKLTFPEIINIVNSVTGRKAKAVNVPSCLGLLFGRIANILNKVPLLPKAPGYECIIKQTLNSTISQHSKRYSYTFDAAEIKPRSFASVAPSYLWRCRKNGQYEIGTTPDWSR